MESAIKPYVEQLSNWVKTEQPPIHIDETTWPVKGIKEWLWVFIAVEAKVRTLLNAEIQSEITSDFLLTRSAILRLLYQENG